MKIDLTGLSNALTDITFNVTEAELEKLEIKKGSYAPLRNLNHETFLEILRNKELKYCSAGSPANVILNASKLGLKTGLYATVGNDITGKNYIRTIEKNQVIPFINKQKGESGVCYILVTPDGERTNAVDLGVSGQFNFDFTKLKDTQIFHTSGYELIRDPEKTKEAIKYAKRYDSRISFDLADRKIVGRMKNSIENLLDDIDILFMTEYEAKELTNKAPIFALRQMSEVCPIVILKKGKNGSIIRCNKEEYEIPIYDVKVKNTCGAGDAYSSGFLFSCIRGFPLDECGHMGSYIASRVCAIDESHL